VTRDRPVSASIIYSNISFKIRTKKGLDTIPWIT